MNIYEKLSEIQAELKAPKNQYNSFGKYNYRNAEDILEAVKPLCKKNKTLLTITDEIKAIGERFYVCAIASLTDLEAPQDRIQVTGYAREDNELKGMTGAQITGSTSSYARKYSLNGLFNIDDTKDADFTNKGDMDRKPSQSDRMPPKTPETPKVMTLHIAENMTALKGDKEVKFKNLTTEELEKLAAQDKRQDWKEAANLILDFKVKHIQEEFKNGNLPFNKVDEAIKE